MIHIDGRDGGGQILRTALGLAALTGKACTIENIRALRANPGLQEQHLQGVKALQKLCDAELDGAEKGSTKVIFIPKTLRDGNLSVTISTAGSIGLVLQALLIPAMKTNQQISINGGATYGKFAPPVHHFDHVIFPLLAKMHFFPKLVVLKHGFYPRGGAAVDVVAKKTTLKPLHITEKGKILSITGISLASKDLQKAEVAERQAKRAKQLLFKKFKLPVKVQTEYVEALNPGSGIQLTIQTEHSFFGGDALGEKGKRAETVAEEAVASLIFSYENGTVDKHTADMLLPYIALAGGSYIVPEITNHVKTNIKVIEQFLDVKFSLKDNFISLV